MSNRSDESDERRGHRRSRFDQVKPGPVLPPSSDSIHSSTKAKPKIDFAFGLKKPSLTESFQKDLIPVSSKPKISFSIKVSYTVT